MEACTDTLKTISLYIYFIDLTKVPHTDSKLKDLTWSRSSSPLTRRSLTHTHCGTKHKGNREGKFCASFVGSTAIVPPAGIAHMHAHVHLPSGRGSARCRRQRRLTGEAEGPRQRSLREMVCVRSSHPPGRAHTNLLVVRRALRLVRRRWLPHLHHLQPFDDRLLVAAWR